MPSRKRIPEETKATIRALKATKDLTLEEIAQRGKVSRTSAHRLTSAQETFLWPKEKNFPRTRGIDSRKH